MLRTVTLPKNVRLFKQCGGKHSKMLSRGIDAVYAQKDGVFDIGEPRLMSYDHKDQLAVPVSFAGEEYFMLVNEMGIPELGTPQTA